MDKKRRTLLIAVAAVLLVVAAFLLLRRPQPLGELIHAAEADASIQAIFDLKATVPTENGETSGICDYIAAPDSEAGQALLDALSGISAHRRFRLPTSLVSVIRAQDNYVSIWFRANGRDHDLYLFADGSVLYDDASRSVAYVLDSDTEDAFRALVNVILRYGTKR